MKIGGWRYYNHAVIPTTLPHEEVDIAPIENGAVWKEYPKAILARWITEFDCQEETDWWYVIKDTPFDISDLKAKRRYEINKGIKNFEATVINPMDYGEEIYNVRVAAFSAYPPKYRPTVNKESFLASLHNLKNDVVIGAFSRETGELCGYATLKNNVDSISFKVLKSNPDHEKNGVNAALVEAIMREFAHLLANGVYISDGARSINHETAFQDYLQKYFGFRKAYCKLHIKYNPRVKWLIKLIYPARKLLLKLDGIGAVHSLNSILRMEEIVRKEKKHK